MIEILVLDFKMVCAKCQKTLKKTELATPSIKRKNEIYHGSSASSDKSRTSATTTGVGKVLSTLDDEAPKIADQICPQQSKLLSKNAKNPYAAYSSSCESCKTKVDRGYKLCHKCAYKAGNGD